MVRAVLVETTVVGRNQHGRLFPFLSGLLRRRGCPVRWLRFALPADAQMGQVETGFDLDEGDRAVLLDALDEARAAAIVCSHLPAPRLIEAIRQRTPQARLAVLASADGHPPSGRVEEISFDAAPIADFFGLPDLPEPDDLMCCPSYGWEPGNAAARADPLVSLLGGPGCTHRPRIDGSRHLASRVADPSRHWGCSFCTVPAADAQPGPKVAPWALLDRQLDAVSATHPAMGPLRFLVEAAAFRQDPLRLARKARDRAPAGSRFQLDFRADQLSELGGEVRAAALALGERSQRLDCHLVGIESFSTPQLDRYLKGCSPTQNLRAIRLLRELERDLPECFSFRSHGGLSTILFDPWAEPGDVGITLALARHFDLERLCGKLYTSRARLTEGLPLAEAARHDGLLVDGYSDPLLDTARRNFYEREIPWRFADPRMESLNRLLTRLSPEPGVREDPLHQELRRWETEAAITPIAQAERLTAIASTSAPMAPEALLESARRAPAVPHPRGSADPAADLRVDMELAAFVAQAKPIMRLEGDPREPAQIRIADEVRQRAPGATTAQRHSIRHGRSEIWFAHDPRRLEEAMALVEVEETASNDDEQRAATARLGELLGYPRCCADAFAREQFRYRDHNGWLLLQRRLRHPPDAAPAASPLLFRYVPCSLACAASLALTDAYRNCLRDDADRSWTEAPVLLSAIPEAYSILDLEDEAATVQGTSGDAVARFRYRPRSVLAPSAHGVLLDGDELDVEPGLVRVRKDGREVGYMVDTFLWSRHGCLHRDFWAEYLRQIDDPIVEPAPPEARATADQPDPCASDPLCLALGRALDKLAARRAPGGPALRGFRVDSIRRDRSACTEGHVVLVLARGEATHEVRLMLRGSGEPAFATSRRFAVQHRSQNWSRADNPVLTLLLSVIERVVGEVPAPAR
jgi:hypothetical protein